MLDKIKNKLIDRKIEILIFLSASCVIFIAYLMLSKYIGLWPYLNIDQSIKIVQALSVLFIGFITMAIQLKTQEIFSKNKERDDEKFKLDKLASWTNYFDWMKEAITLEPINQAELAIEKFKNEYHQSLKGNNQNFDSSSQNLIDNIFEVLEVFSSVRDRV